MKRPHAPTYVRFIPTKAPWSGAPKPTDGLGPLSPALHKRERERVGSLRDHNSRTVSLPSRYSLTPSDQGERCSDGKTYSSRRCRPRAVPVASWGHQDVEEDFYLDYITSASSLHQAGDHVHCRDT